jgi:hypothetical protein
MSHIRSESFLRIFDFMSGEGLVKAMRDQLKMKEIDQVEVKAMRLAPWGTQSAIVVLPSGYIVKDGGNAKITN